MRGSYRGEEREAIRKDWRLNHVPVFIQSEVAPLARFLDRKQSIVAVDGGANKGFWSKALLEYYPQKVKKIYQIDASLENFMELSDVSDSLLFDPPDYSKLVPIHRAISNTVGKIDFYTNDDGSPIGSLFPHKVGEEHTLVGMGDLTTVMQVPCDTLDNIIVEYKIEHIDLLKLDIEGNEFNALLGVEKSYYQRKCGCDHFRVRSSSGRCT